jgi:hypothetical protein
VNFCIISPTSGLQRYGTLSKTHLVLAHINDYKYRHFYQQRREAGDILILDNGAYENGKSVNWNRLSYAITTYKPQVCVLPDTINNPTKTLSDSLRFLDENIDCFPEISWMFMCHWDGSDFHYIDFVAKALFDPRVGHLINWIGVPRCLTTDWKLSRVMVAAALKELRPSLKFHAFGMANGSVSELASLRTSGLFTSVDSSAPVWRGWCGYKLGDDMWDRNGKPIVFNAEDPDTHRDSFERDALILSNLEACDVDTTKLDGC